MEDKSANNGGREVFTVEGTLVLNGREVQGVETTSCKGKYLVASGELDRLLETDKKYRILKISSEQMSELWKSYGCSVGKSGASLAKELIALIGDISRSGVDDSVKEKLEELVKAYNSMTVPADDTEEVARLRRQLQIAEAKLAEAGEPDFRTLGKKLNERSVEVRSGKRIRAQGIMLSLSVRGRTTKEIADALAERGYGNSCAAISRALSVLQPEDRDRLRGIMVSCPDEFSGITDEDFEKWYAMRHEKALKSHKKKLLARRLKEEIEKEFSDTATEAAGDEWGFEDSQG